MYGYYDRSSGNRRGRKPRYEDVGTVCFYRFESRPIHHLYPTVRLSVVSAYGIDLPQLRPSLETHTHFVVRCPTPITSKPRRQSNSVRGIIYCGTMSEVSADHASIRLGHAYL